MRLNLRHIVSPVMLLLLCNDGYAEEEAKQLSLSDGDKVLMTYNAAYLPSPDPKAPWFGRSGFIHPVYTPKGRVVTDGFPRDHMHQHGLMFAWTSAEFDGKPVDFWNSKKRQGYVEHVKTLQADADAITVQLQHVVNRGKKPLPVLKETWKLKRVPHASMNVFDLVSTQSCATDRPVDIRKYHYGGMCIRGPLMWNSGDVMLTSEGKGQADGNHSRPNWVAMFGEVDGEPCGIAAMCHPDNFRAPQPVRLHPKFPYFCFAPMVLGEFKLVPDKPYVSRYRFVAFDGKPDAKHLDEIWRAFTAPEVWKEYVGKVGASGWRCHVIQADPKGHGPDGINLHDWDCDGDVDIFVNYEEGKYSRLYFNPGKKVVRGLWDDFVEFKHGKCEDSGIGDLDNDGDIDYVANGGWIYFNPGKADVRDSSQWKKMTLFNNERRVPVVADVDGDGLNDLIVGAQEWYKQPEKDKHVAENWVKFTIGKNRWPMNCIMTDVDGDGDVDMVVPDRGVEICWYVNPGTDKVTGQWERRTLHKHEEPMFMTVADVNGDQLKDFIITGGSKGKLARKLIVLLRTNQSGDPTFKEILIDQPGGSFPKGVKVMDLDGDGKVSEILVIPKQGDLWTAGYTGDAMQSENWKATPIKMPGAETRKKMDNAFVGDLDGDGDLDIVTTEENGGWGVIWFENPAKN